MGELRVPDVFAGYRIERVLGEGGMGRVYLAHDPRLPRFVALKVMGPESFADNEFRGRFEQEAAIVARLDHPNIVTVYDRGIEGQSLWIAMQYIAGTDAASLDVGATERVARIVRDTADALDYAHHHGVLHRDVKPANILLTRAEAGQPERALLADFGIARRQSGTKRLTQAGFFNATLEFAPPEQLAGEDVDHRGDQYSLACTAFALLAGDSPFAATNPVQIIESHLWQPPPAVSGRRPELPPRVDAVMHTALAKDPADRYHSCGEFASALTEALHANDSPAAATMTPGELATATTRITPAPTPAPYPSEPPQTIAEPIPPAKSSQKTRQQTHSSPDSVIRSSGSTNPRRWFLVTAALVVVLLVAGFLLFRLLPAQEPRFSTTMAQVQAALPPELAATSTDCHPGTIDIPGGKGGGRQHITTAVCRLTKPAGLNFPIAGTFDAYLDGPRVKHHLAEATQHSSGEPTLWNADKTACLTQVHGPHPTYYNTSRDLIVTFHLASPHTPTQLQEYLHITALL